MVTWPHGTRSFRNIFFVITNLSVSVSLTHTYICINIVSAAICMHLINITKNQHMHAAEQSPLMSTHHTHICMHVHRPAGFKVSLNVINSSRPQQSLFRPAPTTRRPRYGRHGGGNRLAGFPRTPSHRSGPFRAQLKARAALLQRPPALLRRLEATGLQQLLPPAAGASHAWCTCTGPLLRWLEEAPLAATPLHAPRPHTTTLSTDTAVPRPDPTSPSRRPVAHARRTAGAPQCIPGSQEDPPVSLLYRGRQPPLPLS